MSEGDRERQIANETLRELYERAKQDAGKTPPPPPPPALQYSEGN